MTAQLGDRLGSASIRPRYVRTGKTAVKDEKWRPDSRQATEVRTPIEKVQDKLFELVALAWFGLMGDR